MDNVRLLLFMALAFLSLLIWEAWQEDYVLPQQNQTAANSQAVSEDGPNIPLSNPSDPVMSASGTVPAIAADNRVGEYIEVKTDTLDLRISTTGGAVHDAKLIQYPVSIDTPHIKYHLMSTRPGDYFIAQSGLAGADKQRTPNHTARFVAEKAQYEMLEGEDQLVVDLQWTSADGVRVTKRYTFTRGKHSIDLQHIVENGSTEPWRGREYRELVRGEPSDSGNFLMYTYTGGAIFSPTDKYQKYDLGELAQKELDRDVDNGWIAMIQHYFLGAYVPPRNSQQHFYGRGTAEGRSAIGSYTQPMAVAPGETGNFTGLLVIGPKLQSELEPLAEGLDLTVDYGWLVFIAKPMHWILEQINQVVVNWGWTIILFTILIKIVFYKLSETSYRSMAHMRKMTPRIQALKDRYGDDKQRMQQAMMEMYKKEKINPLGGCLPMLVQIPFFISLYWVLLESVEMRQAPWIFWIQDLSIKDPYFVLPVIMAASMFVQQKLNPAPPDPMQAKIMLYLPLVFGIMFAFFPSGLVLYWVVNNLLSILQQWVITRRIEADSNA